MAFRKIHDWIWSNPDFLALGDTERILYLYLLTSSHSNSTGYYMIKIGYMAEDLKWSVEKIKKYLSKLQENPIDTPSIGDQCSIDGASNGDRYSTDGGSIGDKYPIEGASIPHPYPIEGVSDTKTNTQKGLIEYDEQKFMVFIPKFLEHNNVESWKSLSGAIKTVKSLPKSRIINGLIDILERLMNEFPECKEVLPDRVSIPHPYPIDTPSKGYRSPTEGGSNGDRCPIDAQRGERGDREGIQRGERGEGKEAGNRNCGDSPPGEPPAPRPAPDPVFIFIPSKKSAEDVGIKESIVRKWEEEFFDMDVRMLCKRALHWAESKVKKKQRNYLCLPENIESWIYRTWLTREWDKRNYPRRPNAMTPTAQAQTVQAKAIPGGVPLFGDLPDNGKTDPTLLKLREHTAKTIVDRVSRTDLETLNGFCILSYDAAKAVSVCQSPSVMNQKTIERELRPILSGIFSDCMEQEISVVLQAH
jgi:hypothetical protein